MTAEHIEGRASDLLAQFGITEPPVNPSAIAKAMGFRIRAAIFDDPDVRGRVSVGHGAGRIDIDACESAPRRRFTVAHELGHAVLHLIGTRRKHYLDTRSDIRAGGLVPAWPGDETDANRFAAALLMPRAWLQHPYRDHSDPASLAQTFNVSLDAMVHRLHDIERGVVE